MMCYLLPLLLMLGTALLTWLASKNSIQSNIENEFESRLTESDERYHSLSNEYIGYVEKNKQSENTYATYKSDYDAVSSDRAHWKTKYTNLFIENEQQSKEYQANLSHWEQKFVQMENEQVDALQSKNNEIASWNTKYSDLESEMIVAKTSFSAAIPAEKIVEVERIVERVVSVPVEIIKEVERIVEIPVEVIREVEVIKEVEKIVEVERIVEVPVEVIREVEVVKEVERIVEMPVEVIREVEVIKEVERIVEIPVEVIREVEVIKEVERIVEIPVEVIREVEVIKEVEKIVEIIKEIEVIKEVPIEIIREIEVTREIDMESLMAMLGQMGTVEVSRTMLSAEPDPVQEVASMAVATENAVVEVVVEEVIVVKKQDDLTIIEGIGPKIAELLYNDGITSFKQLAITEISYIKILLERAGSRFQMHKPDTWPEQARIAAEGRWDDLKTWQEELNAGKK